MELLWAPLVVLLALLITALFLRLGRLERRLERLEFRQHARATPADSRPEAAAPAQPPASLPGESQPRLYPPSPTPQPRLAGEREGAPVTPPAVWRLGERLRRDFAGQEWEAVLGGSWLNKAGVLVLVIGIALFIGYSLTELGPAGRIAVGLGTALALLALGFAAERRAGYRVIGRGLMAGGWAALYFTTYAMFALPAARIVDSPALGFALLLAVAAGMVAHALRYRHEAVLVLAYAVAYATLLLAPGAIFATLATYPLLLSLVAVVVRRHWRTLGLAGMLFNYGLYLFVLARQPPPTVMWQDLAISLGVLAGYWLIFEVTDLIALRRGPHQDWAAQTLAPLNHALWLGSTAVIWELAQPAALPGVPLGAGLAALTLIFLGSAIMRARLLPPIPGGGPVAFERRLVAGGYELALLLAVCAAVGFAFRRLEGLGQLLMLLVEGEALWLAGWLLRQPFASRLGAAVLAIAVARGTWELYAGRPLDWWGIPVTTWTPQGLALLTVAAFNLYRLRSQPAVHPREPAAWAYLGTVLVALLAWRVLPPTLVAGAWGIQALIWCEWGRRVNSRLLRQQGHALAVATFARVILANLTTFGATGLISHRLLLLIPLIALFYFLAARAAGGPNPPHQPRDAEPWELRVGIWHLYAAAIVTALLLRFELGRVAATIGWIVQGLALVYLGRRLGHRHLLLQGNLLALAVFARAWSTNLEVSNEFAGIFGRLSTGLFVTACFFAGFFIVPVIPADASTPSATRLQRLWRLLERHAKAGYVLLGAALLALLCFYEVSGQLLTMAWGLESVGLLAAGFILRQRLWRISGLLLFVASLAKLFIHDMRALDTPWRILSFIALGAMMLGVSWAYARFRNRIGPLI